MGDEEPKHDDKPRSKQRPPTTNTRPTTSAQLRGIAGIGDKKLEHYGDDLLALVKTLEG